MKSPSKQCYFCAANIKVVDFKDSQMLRKFMTPQAQITRRRKTGTCALHQRKLGEAIKRARFLGLAPYVSR
ncbi:30S ribosomal protein S18 [Candidatus Giovannonibacteria bacterium RIFCSPLOWO2_12_FULL_44_25]|uniref:Small ribosomal subunit protein bS18 n=1 Tax=Candidatus Giovannonibacteria bacterium RIFCSPHIGHO2_02_FULL_45_40 TaxID=1798337 RepID=A0A1F5WBA8_9BACT|nr:MAG: 30S ribosomal protein S18 [Candidatus Giovannonibacteria bacterium GWA2_45_15]OGF60418.1 MAG: 30S ribosomal protein S18 [Candidatus Giovannonibacteria bacterium RIFCSPHIGHO2_01_45_12]OGF60797.1 MAG: 30S ribosomal protein S18 [Candidatus Giovannonibacteria bacterium RIFCSPHIGHO2_01_FULL_44_100]OGF72937.1 MAG: 30S ribosomal protein S18 [Candidatus Giovannonibacteria bacterium RIFCSPHIGHO2_02_FULL_45_40]OGF84270.1 MAG: 30S ribosomal protein S18 [Candidatus Giovannonibacteria bacterium RIFC